LSPPWNLLAAPVVDTDEKAMNPSEVTVLWVSEEIVSSTFDFTIDGVNTACFDITGLSGDHMM
jgi:hypothetical protein